MAAASRGSARGASPEQPAAEKTLLRGAPGEELMRARTAETAPTRATGSCPTRNEAGRHRHPQAAHPLSYRRLCQDWAQTRDASARGHLHALQSTEVETLPMVTSSGTILGTSRMGNDPRQSVVDRDLRAHDHANLFIVGGMVFPTAGMHPPTLTIAALALRAALTIKQGFAG